MNKFYQIFKDNNDWNEKTIIGFLSFAVMVVVMVFDILTGAFGKDLAVNEFVYNSFLIVTLGSFGIAGLEKFAKQKEAPEATEATEENK
jgi:cell shape-determining protein MreD